MVNKVEYDVRWYPLAQGSGSVGGTDDMYHHRQWHQNVDELNSTSDGRRDDSQEDQAASAVPPVLTDSPPAVDT